MMANTGSTAVSTVRNSFTRRMKTFSRRRINHNFARAENKFLRPDHAAGRGGSGGVGGLGMTGGGAGVLSIFNLSPSEECAASLVLLM